MQLSPWRWIKENKTLLFKQVKWRLFCTLLYRNESLQSPGKSCSRHNFMTGFAIHLPKLLICFPKSHLWVKSGSQRKISLRFYMWECYKLPRFLSNYCGNPRGKKGGKCLWCYFVSGPLFCPSLFKVYNITDTKVRHFQEDSTPCLTNRAVFQSDW